MDEQVPVAVVVVTSIIMVGSALLVHRVGKRAAEGSLGRNGIAGIRIPSTLESEEAWLAGHRAARRPNDIGAMGMGLAGVLVVWFRENAAIFITLALLGVLWVFVWTLLSAKQAASAARTVSNNDAA